MLVVPFEISQSNELAPWNNCITPPNRNTIIPHKKVSTLPNAHTGRGDRIRCALGLCRRLRAVSGKTFVLPTSPTENPIAAFRRLRRTCSAGSHPTNSIKSKTPPVWERFYFWSRWQDSNLRPLRPERSALPNWATPRDIKLYDFFATNKLY